MMGKSLLANTPDTHERLRVALETVRRGVEASGVVLELRRKDDGRPIWIKWWSRPMPGGKFTRTMFIDITDSVLIEQEKSRLEAQNAYLLDEIRSEHNFGDMIGAAPVCAK